MLVFGEDCTIRESGYKRISFYISIAKRSYVGNFTGCGEVEFMSNPNRAIIVLPFVANDLVSAEDCNHEKSYAVHEEVALTNCINNQEILTE